VAEPSVMVALCCFTAGTELLWQHAKMSQMATGVGWGPVWITPLHCPTPKPPLWFKDLALISYTSRVIANFVFKYPNFCYHDNRGLWKTSCNDTVKSAGPENSLWYQNVRIVSYENRVIANTTVRGLKEDFTDSRSPYCNSRSQQVLYT